VIAVIQFLGEPHHEICCLFGTFGVAVYGPKQDAEPQDLLLPLHMSGKESNEISGKNDTQGQS